jgi:predicted transcriptional regulator
MERNICLNWPALVEEAIKRRKEQRLSQKMLAVLAGVSKPVVVNFEKGSTKITLANVLKILHMLGLSEGGVNEAA